MENLSRYSNTLKDKKELTVEEAHQLAMLRMIRRKIEIKYGFTKAEDIAKLLGYHSSYFAGMFTGRIKIPKRLIASMCFVAGVDLDDFYKEYTAVTVDEYVNGKGQLIVDGVNYGKITK